MSTYIEYELEDGMTVLIEGPEDENGRIVKASAGGDDIASVKAKKGFSVAMQDIKVQARLLLKEISDLHVEEVEIKFGINTVGELGNMAIGKLGVGVNYEVMLKWKKPEQKNVE